MNPASLGILNPLGAIRVSSVMGLGVSLYFLAIYKGWIEGNKGLVPVVVCKENSCAPVLQTSFARVFKVPNFVLGIAYYLIMIASSFTPLLSLGRLAFLTISWFVVGLSFYLAYALVFRLKTMCMLCFVSHILNLIIAVALLIG